jgi:sugar transferase EpsL
LPASSRRPATITLIAAIVWCGLGSPVLLRQQRPGRYCKPFRLYKFRTMSDARDASGALLPDAERLSRAGRILRRLSLDELPQLWNVLRGDMSIVGPRPLPMAYLDRYTPEQARRNDVKPGITGRAQINGRNAISWEEKLALDVWYVNNHSFALDLKILAVTIANVVWRYGIAAPGHESMPEFLGAAAPQRGSGSRRRHDHARRLGASGMLGHKLIQRLNAEFGVAGTIRDRQPTAALRQELPGIRIYPNVNACDMEALGAAMVDWEADVVVNCIGIVKQAKAASEPIPSIAICPVAAPDSRTCGRARRAAHPFQHGLRLQRPVRRLYGERPPRSRGPLRANQAFGRGFRTRRPDVPPTECIPRFRG